MTDEEKVQYLKERSAKLLKLRTAPRSEIYARGKELMAEWFPGKSPEELLTAVIGVNGAEDMTKMGDLMYLGAYLTEQWCRRQWAACEAMRCTDLESGGLDPFTGLVNAFLAGFLLGQGRTITVDPIVLEQSIKEEPKIISDVLRCLNTELAIGRQAVRQMQHSKPQEGKEYPGSSKMVH